MPTEAQFAPPEDDPLRKATPSVDDVEARRAKAAIEGRLFSGPARRVKVGRYRVLGRIGAGGMGVVYKANDPELARDVAVKLMNTDAVADTDADQARGRLVREARAMARLAHPNVIHVYDVGTVEDGVFIAMELVEGESLRAWLEAEKRPWKEVLQRFIEAGRGLAAAHEAGVIHRDFKPENVLCGADGRVRVGDFGLAGGPGSETGKHEPAASESVRAKIDESAVSEALTRTGALLGTPKYMAPEQEAGISATARGDQFSFCVALYEALYGQAPFAGDSVIQYRLSVREGSVRPPPASDVPEWIATELLKGLSASPADRHGSVQALLDRLAEALVDPVVTTLQPPPRSKRPMLWFGAVAVLTGFAVAAGYVLLQPAPPVVQPGSVLVVKGDAKTPEKRPEPPEKQPETKAAVSIEPVPEEPEAEDNPPEPTEKPFRTTQGVGPKSPRTRGDACYFNDRNIYFKATRSSLKKFQIGLTCYECRDAPPGLLPNLNPDPGIQCGKKLKCESQRCGKPG